MPFLTSVAESIPVMSLPWRWTLPPEGRKAPVITLKSVVFPAPLGPMKPQICFSGISKLTSLSAATPPKYLVRALTFRIATWSPKKPKQFLQQAGQTIGFQQDDQD